MQATHSPHMLTCMIRETRLRSHHHGGGDGHVLRPASSAVRPPRRPGTPGSAFCPVTGLHFLAELGTSGSLSFTLFSASFALRGFLRSARARFLKLGSGLLWGDASVLPALLQSSTQMVSRASLCGLCFHCARANTGCGRAGSQGRCMCLTV